MKFIKHPEGTKVLVKQVRGAANRPRSTRATLEALGLGRPGKEREHTINDSVQGMIHRVRHLVEVRGKEA